MSGETLAMNSVRRVELVARVVEARNQQRDDFDPEPHLVQSPDRVENGLEPPAEFAVVAVVEALEIDFVEIDPRADVLEHLRRAVAVRDVAGDEPCGFGFLEHGHRPLARDQRLVVGADHRARPLTQARRCTRSSGDASTGGATAAGSRSACEVTQFWQ